MVKNLNKVDNIGIFDQLILKFEFITKSVMSD